MKFTLEVSFGSSANTKFKILFSDYDNEFDQIYPDYEDYDTPGNGIQVHKQGFPDPRTVD